MSIERRIDPRGRAQHVRKTTQAEIDRRAVLIAKHYRRGHSIAEIAAALDVSPGVVNVALQEMDPHRPRRVRGRGRIIEPCPWRDEHLPEVERYIPSPEEAQSRWRQSRIVGMAQMLNDEFSESNFANILANQATDAEAAGDVRWALDALATFAAAMEKLERARRVLTDEHYRVLCRDTLEGVEQMRHAVPLRAVR